LEDSLSKALAIIEIIEHDVTCVNLSPKGEPQLGRRGLYKNTGGTSPADFEMALLWVLNFSDGRHSLLDIADRAVVPFSTIRSAAIALRDAGLLLIGDERHARIETGIPGPALTPVRSRASVTRAPATSR